MGIGLAVSRSIIQAHDEQLWAENNPDYVADLSIRLPIATVRSDQYVPQELTISGVQRSPRFGDSSHRRGFIADFCEEFRAAASRKFAVLRAPDAASPGQNLTGFSLRQYERRKKCRLCRFGEIAQNLAQ